MTSRWVRGFLLPVLAGVALQAAGPGLEIEGGKGPGKGKHVVLVSGDEEYRSEQMLPQLARILAQRHGFRCTVLFSIDRADGTINPNTRDNIPGLEALDRADLMILFTRWRNLPDEQMKHIVDYVESGRPVIGLRTATHAFKQETNPTYKRYAWDSKEWDGGFGRQVLGETWISHHGRHGVQSSRGVVVKGMEKHPVLRGVAEAGVWVPTDVYTVRLPLPGDSEALLLGQVLEGMQPGDQPLSGKPNDPMLPVAWVKSFTGQSGKKARVFTTTMGSGQDFESEGFRRLLVNATYWTLGLEKRIPAKADVAVVGDYKGLPFKNNGFTKGVKPADLASR
jgi:hypothetical protein